MSDEYTGPGGRYAFWDEPTLEDYNALVAAVAGEARGESLVGQVMIALGTLNRAAIGMKHEGNRSGKTIRDVLDIAQVNAAGYKIKDPAVELKAAVAVSEALNWVQTWQPSDKIKDAGFTDRPPQFTYWYNPDKANPAWARQSRYGIADSFRVGSHVFVPGRANSTVPLADAYNRGPKYALGPEYVVPQPELTVEQELELLNARPAPFPGIRPETAAQWAQAKQLAQIFQRGGGVAYVNSAGEKVFISQDTINTYADAMTWMGEGDVYDMDDTLANPFQGIVEVQFEELDPTDLALIRTEREYPEVFAEDNIKRLREDQDILLAERRQAAGDAFLDELRASYSSGEIQRGIMQARAAMGHDDEMELISREIEEIPEQDLRSYFADLATDPTPPSGLGGSPAHFSISDFDVVDETAPLALEEQSEPAIVTQGPPNVKEVAKRVYDGIVNRARDLIAQGEVAADYLSGIIVEANRMRQNIINEPLNSNRTLGDILSAGEGVFNFIGPELRRNLYEAQDINIDPRQTLQRNILNNFGPGKAFEPDTYEVRPPRPKPEYKTPIDDTPLDLSPTSGFYDVPQIEVRDTPENKGRGATEIETAPAPPPTPETPTTREDIRPETGTEPQSIARVPAPSAADPLSRILNPPRERQINVARPAPAPAISPETNAAWSARIRQQEQETVKSEAQRVFQNPASQQVFDYPNKKADFTGALAPNRTGGRMVSGPGGYTQGSLTDPIPSTRPRSRISQHGFKQATENRLRTLTYFDEITVTKRVPVIHKPGSPEARRLASIYGEYAHSRTGTGPYTPHPRPKPQFKIVKQKKRIARTKQVSVPVKVKVPVAAPAPAPVTRSQPSRPTPPPTPRQHPSLIQGQRIIGHAAGGVPIIQDSSGNRYRGFVGGGTNTYQGRSYTTRVRDSRGQPLGRGTSRR